MSTQYPSGPPSVNGTKVTTDTASKPPSAQHKTLQRVHAAIARRVMGK